MKNVNRIKAAKKLVVIAMAAIAACSVMGCSMTKTTTYTETYTDENGNTTTTTTTTVQDENGVRTETTTETADEAEVYENVKLSIENNLCGDIAGMCLKMSSNDEWSDNFLGEDEFIEDGQVVSGLNATYDSEDHYMDIVVYDREGNDLEFDEIELPTDNNEQITLVLEYDEVEDSFYAYIA